MRHKTRACALAQALTKARARDLLFHCRQTEVVRLLEGAKDEKLAAVVLNLVLAPNQTMVLRTPSSAS